MERKPFQDGDGRDGDRFRDGREGDCYRDRREDFQGRDGWGCREYQEYNDRDLRQNRQVIRDRDQDQRDF